MGLFKITTKKTKKFNDKLNSYSYRIDYLCSADSILFCSICYKDAINKLETLKKMAAEGNLDFNYNEKRDFLDTGKRMCFDAALAREIEKILDDLTVNKNIQLFIDKLEDLNTDYISNKSEFSSKGVALFDNFFKKASTLILDYKNSIIKEDSFNDLCEIKEKTKEFTDVFK